MPWDIKRGGAGRGLLEAGPRALCELQVAASRMTHFAPNCVTLYRARDKPPKGATRWTPRLRSNLHPRGLPQLWTTPTRKGKGERVEKDNCMVDWAIEECIKAAKEGRGFSLESPLRAYLWLFPRAVELEEMEGTIDIDYTACMFSPGTRRKKQRLRTNRKGLVAALSRCCEEDKVCARTLVAHASWDPSLNKDGSVKEFRTGPEAEYPAEWCQLFAAAIVAEEACDLKKAGNFIFSEVVSGPAAP